GSLVACAIDQMAHPGVIEVGKVERRWELVVGEDRGTVANQFQAQDRIGSLNALHYSALRADADEILCVSPKIILDAYPQYGSGPGGRAPDIHAQPVWRK